MLLIAAAVGRLTEEGVLKRRFSARVSKINLICPDFLDTKKQPNVGDLPRALTNRIMPQACKRCKKEAYTRGFLNRAGSL